MFPPDYFGGGCGLSEGVVLVPLPLPPVELEPVPEVPLPPVEVDPLP